MTTPTTTMMKKKYGRILKDDENDEDGGKGDNNDGDGGKGDNDNNNNNNKKDDENYYYSSYENDEGAGGHSNNNYNSAVGNSQYNASTSTTIDPSPWTFIVCISLCTVLAYLLPLILAVRQLRMKRTAAAAAATGIAATHESKTAKNTLPSRKDNDVVEPQELGLMNATSPYSKMTGDVSGNNNSNHPPDDSWYFSTERPTEMILCSVSTFHDEEEEGNNNNTTTTQSRGGGVSGYMSTALNGRRPKRSRAYGDLFGGIAKASVVGGRQLGKRKANDVDITRTSRRSSSSTATAAKKRDRSKSRRKKKRTRLMIGGLRGMSDVENKAAVLLTYVSSNGRRQQLHNAANEIAINPYVDSDDGESYDSAPNTDTEMDENDSHSVTGHSAGADNNKRNVKNADDEEEEDHQSVQTEFSSRYTVMTDDGSKPRPSKKESTIVTQHKSVDTSTLQRSIAPSGPNSGGAGGAAHTDEDEDEDDALSDCTEETVGEEDALTMVVHEIEEFINDVDLPDDVSLASGWQERVDSQTGNMYYVNPQNGLYCVDRPIHPIPERKEISLTGGGPRPWYTYYCSTGLWRKVYKCLQYDDEMKKIADLAIPYTAHTAFTYGFSLMETAVIGRLLGIVDLAAYFAVGVAIDFATMLLTGSMSCLSVLVSQAIGANNKKLAGTYVQLSVWTHQLCYIPFVFLSWNRFDSILTWMGFDQDTANAAGRYAQFALVYQIFAAYSSAIGYVLEVDGHEKYSAIFNTAHSAASLLLVGGVSLFSDMVELWMIGAIHLFLLVVFLGMNITYIVYKGWFTGYWRGMIGSNPFADWGPVQTFVRNATPLAFGYVIAYCEWDLMYLFAARQGPAEVAVWGLLGGVWGMTEGIVMGISDASGVRVALLVGSGRPDQAKYSSEKALVVGIILSVLMAGILGLLQYPLPTWFTNDETLQAMFRELMPLVCLAVFLLSAGNIAWSVLCAQGRSHVATTITAVGSMAISIPLAFISSHVLHLNLSGLVASIIIGYTLSGYLNTVLMLTTNWTRVSDRATKRNRKAELTEEKKRAKAMRQKQSAEKKKKIDLPV